MHLTSCKDNSVSTGLVNFEIFEPKIYFIMTEKERINEKIKLYEKKYGQTFDEFEIRSKQSGNENFEEWDDLIEWEAYTRFLNKKDIVNK